MVTTLVAYVIFPLSKGGTQGIKLTLFNKATSGKHSEEDVGLLGLTLQNNTFQLSSANTTLTIGELFA